MVQKTVCISGVSRGIGLELAKRFLDAEYKVIGISRSDADNYLSGKNGYKHVKTNLGMECSTPKQL